MINRSIPAFPTREKRYTIFHLADPRTCLSHYIGRDAFPRVPDPGIRQFRQFPPSRPGTRGRRGKNALVPRTRESCRWREARARPVIARFGNSAYLTFQNVDAFEFRDRSLAFGRS